MTQENFTKLLKEYGDRLDNKKAFNGLVKDFFMDEPLQANLIMALYDMNIQGEILTAASISNTFAFRFVKRLMDEHGTSRKNADWAVSTWCVCYGQEILHKLCEVKLFDASSSYRPAIDKPQSNSTAYKDLFTYKKNSTGYSVTGFVGENKSTIIFQDKFQGNPVTEVEENSFAGITLQQAILPDGYKKIGVKAFQACNELSQVVLPMSLTEIEDFAFESCSKLSSISFPVNLAQIGKYAFADTDLKSITFPEVLYWIGEGAFSNCTKLNGITVGKRITAIPDKCFEGCSSLTKVRLCEGIESIGMEAFWKCSNLLQISIPDSVTKIGEAAFAGTADKFVLQCSMGSFAESYARQHKLKYQLV